MPVDDRFVRVDVMSSDTAVASTVRRSDVAGRSPALRHAGLELFIAAAVFFVYRAGRLLTNDSNESAMANAQWVLDVQRPVTGSLERSVQQFVLNVPGVIDVLNHFYVLVHFPATTLFLVWVFVSRRGAYAAVRNWFVGVTMAAMVIHAVFPLAPPRMLDGFVDTLREYGPSIYPADTTTSVANQFAAMPSLHFGWALMVAVAAIVLTSGRRRWWWLAHPAVTLVAIVATANHFVLDALIAAALAAAVGVLVLRRHRTAIRGEHSGPTRARQIRGDDDAGARFTSDGGREQASSSREGDDCLVA